MGLKKKYATVIMDGSDENKVKHIKSILGMLALERDEDMNCRPLDEQHPTMTVIEAIMTPLNYAIVMDTVEGAYPGLCVFDPAM